MYNDDLKVAVAYPSFFGAFKVYFPNLTIIRDIKDVSNQDLIIFTGGEDINPNIYGQENTYSSYTEERDAIETKIFNYAYEKHIKMLGVCRGHQLLNALLGGYLIQDIYLESDGRSRHSSHHKLEFQDGISLTRYLFNGLEVNSMHHQGVVGLGSGLRATSYYKGIVESCEGKFAYTVQFHPEFFSDRRFAEVFFAHVYLWVLNSRKIEERILAKENPLNIIEYIEEYKSKKDTNIEEVVENKKSKMLNLEYNDKSKELEDAVVRYNSWITGSSTTNYTIPPVEPPVELPF